MGMMLGKITVETPKYKTLEKKDEIEIREYEPSVVCEVTYDPKEMKRGRDGGFMILAGYIGAIGTPCNKKGSEGGEKIAMTAPVITQEHSEHLNLSSHSIWILLSKKDNIVEENVFIT